MGGYLYSLETYRYAEELKEKLGLNLQEYQPLLTPARQEAIHGKLWEQGDEGMQQYALLNKVEPMSRALEDIGGDIWLSGVRRSQSKTRADRGFAEQQKATIKAYPILDWADAQVASYYYENNLPKHPLEAEGFVTMGDWHSTVPLTEGMTAEETRYGGQKYECGLHLESSTNDFQI